MDGKKLAESMLADLKKTIRNRKLKPKLAVVLVGDDPGSLVYVERKQRAAEEIGVAFELRKFASAKPNDLLKAINALNKDKGVTGIIVQLPIPGIDDPSAIMAAIDPKKDVDGMSPVNTNALWTLTERNLEKSDYLLPCTALGVARLLDEYKVDVKGKHVVVVGRSNAVGKPLAAVMLARDAAVTIVHKEIDELMDYTLTAHILVVAAGVKHLVKANMVPVGSVVVDVGITRTAKGLFGDVDPSVQKKVKLISPVPGGVGPMTVASLMANVVKAAQLQKS